MMEFEIKELYKSYGIAFCGLDDCQKLDLVRLCAYRLKGDSSGLGIELNNFPTELISAVCGIATKAPLVRIMSIASDSLDNSFSEEMTAA